MPIPCGLGTTIHVDDPTKRPSFASAKKIESLIYGLHERTASTVSSVSTLERLIEKAKGTMSDGVRQVTIPRHNPIKAFTMGGIVQDAGLTSEEFRKLL